jgi:predicted transcriptional regulator
MKPSRKQHRAIRQVFKTGDRLLKEAMRDQEGTPEDVVVVPFDPERLAKIFTLQRLRLLGELHRSRPRSLTELARRLDRNVSRVRHDVELLEAAHLAVTVRHGNRVAARASWAHFVVAPPG